MTQGIAHYKIGDPFSGFMLIREARKGVASNGKPFLTLMFRDKTGEIEAKLWDASTEDEEAYTAETIVKLQGMIGEFRGQAQFRINSIRPAVATDGVSLNDFLETAPIQKEVLYEKIMEATFAMENPNIQRIVRAFINKYKEDLLQYPAATRNHHEYVSGLAHHIVSMLNIARELSKLYLEINKDLLYAGIILHDLGKLHELSGVTSPTYTTKGKLLGHIPMMVSEIESVADELNITGEEVLILQHLVLSLIYTYVRIKVNNLAKTLQNPFIAKGFFSFSFY